MGPASFIIALLGCADGSSACQQVAIMPVRYDSREACSAATSAVLVANTDFDFPTIVAECRAAKAPASTRAEPSKATARDKRRS